MMGADIPMGRLAHTAEIYLSTDICDLTNPPLPQYIPIYRDIHREGVAPMSRFSLQEEVPEFAGKVVALVTPKYGNHWRDRVERLWTDVQERGFTERTNSTKKLYMSKFRKGVRDALAEAEPNAERLLRVEAELMEILRIDPEILSKLHQDYQAKVKETNRDLVLVPEWEWIVTMLKHMLVHKDMELRVIGLMGLTGRRFREILQSGDFEPVISETDRGMVRQRWLLTFKGQLKTKGGPNTMSGRGFVIPVLEEADKVLKAFRELRASPKGREWMNAPEGVLKSTLNNAFNKALTDSPIAKVWPDKAPLSLKELRGLYAEIAYVNFGPRTTRGPYFSRILGHSEEDETTALSYMRYSLNTRGLEESMEEVNRLTMLREKRRDEAIAAKGADAGDAPGEAVIDDD